MIVADTNALIWLLEDIPILGRQSRELIEGAYGSDSLLASAFSYWEVALLIKLDRLDIKVSAEEFRRRAFDFGVREIPVTGDIGIAAVALDGLHRDPADRIIVATALAHDATLITADRRLLDWAGPLKRHDARL